MRIIYSGGFSDHERFQARAVIFTNLIDSCKGLLHLMVEESLEFSTERAQTSANLIRESNSNDLAEATMSVAVCNAIKHLWEDKGVQEAAIRSRHLPFYDNMIYFNNSMDRLSSREWLPDNQDILQARLRTTGISETFFNLGSMNWLIDVGGQRSERRKWIQCFEDVTCLIFVAALSGYDQCLVEEHDSNQLQESMRIFDSLVNSKWFKRKPIILFLNKFDLFEKRLSISPFSQHYPDFPGSDTDLYAAAKYVNDCFLDMDEAQDRDVFTHYTTATNTDLLKETMELVESAIVLQNLRSYDNNVTLPCEMLHGLGMKSSKGRSATQFNKLLKRLNMAAVEASYQEKENLVMLTSSQNRLYRWLALISRRSVRSNRRLMHFDRDSLRSEIDCTPPAKVFSALTLEWALISGSTPKGNFSRRVLGDIVVVLPAPITA
ncbi:hypothetical protein N7451_008904 [Penicillium sp. IBT 35674x]|nr:hypothetical protein N7451_008904 [Penicillium sp. IBT 35674x]